MKPSQALDLINTVDSRHQAMQPILRRIVRGETVTDEELAAVESPFAPLVPILTDIRDRKADQQTIAAINALDTRNAVLKPLLGALVAGLKD